MLNARPARQIFPAEKGNTPVSEKTGLLYAVNEKAPLIIVVVMGIQHVLLLYSEITLLPVIMGHRAGAPLEHILFASGAAGIASGITTLIQVLRLGRFGAGYTLFMGTSAAYMAGCVETIKAGGFPLLAALSILVAPIEMIMAYFLRFLRHIITPAVGGTIILLVVMSLAPVSIAEWMGHHGHPFYGSRENFLIGLSAMCILLGISLFGNRSLRQWCPLIGMAGGLLVSWSLGVLDLEKAFSYPWIGTFPGSWPGIATDLKMEHLPLFAVLAVLTVVNGVQAIGNSMAVQTISHREDRQIDYQVIQGTMYGDALGNVITGALGTAPNETYAENIAAMKVTGATCRAIGVCGAILLILLPFSPKISMAAVQLPTPIFGGFLMGLAAMMFPAGLELVFSHGITHRSGLLVGISLCVGLIAESGYFFPNIFPISVNVFLKSGVAAGGLAAVLLSVLFRLTEMKGYATRIPAGLSNLRLLARRVKEAGEELDISPERIMKLQLACEEIFVHVVTGENFEREKRSMVLRINELESGIRVEIIFGEHLDDLKNVEIPDNLMHADPSDLDQLGLALFHTIVDDFHQAMISGRTYIWFKLA